MWPYLIVLLVLTIGLLIALLVFLSQPHTEGFESEYILPKIAWTHWNTNRPPKMIRDILENREKTMVGWETRFITDDVTEYINANEIPANFYKLSPPHRADWIRLAILYKYGGVWMDAGIIVNDVSAMDDMYKETLQKKAELTAFYPNDTSYIDNWFLMAPKGSPLIKEWLEEYEKAIRVGFIPYKAYLLETPTVFSEYNVKNPTDVYLTAQAGLQYIIQKKAEKPNIILHNATYSMMKLHADCSFDKENQAICIRDKILNEPETKHIPFIKLRREDRIFDIEPYFTYKN